MIETVLHRLTTEEYHRMGENGMIPPDARVELLDGRIVPMFPIGSHHNSAVYWLNEKLTAASRGRWILAPQCSLKLNDYYEPQPDFALLRPRKDRYRSAIPTANDVFLLIEVSDSSLLLDREEKLPAYAHHGVPEVWIVNAQRQHVEVYRAPRSEEYAEKTIVSLGETLSPEAFPDVALEVTELFNG